nr:novel protein [Danio rerio]
MGRLSLVLTLMLMNCSLLISADDCDGPTDVVTACEGFLLYLTCPKHHKITIIDALYGRKTKAICYDQPQDQLQNTNCYSPHALHIVSERCNGSVHCAIHATNSVFSNPCEHTYKYLRVKYCCEHHRS